MRFLKFNLLLLLVPTLSFALNSSDDVVCSGGMYGDKHVYLRTENAGGQKNLSLFMCDGECSQPPYFFEASYKVNRFENVVSNIGRFQQSHILEISADSDVRDDGSRPFANVSVDLLDANLEAMLVMTPPGARSGDSERAAIIYLTHCELVTGGNRPMPAR
jgi:hypothetical protein